MKDSVKNALFSFFSHYEKIKNMFNSYDGSSSSKPVIENLINNIESEKENLNSDNIELVYDTATGLDSFLYNNVKKKIKYVPKGWEDIKYEIDQLILYNNHVRNRLSFDVSSLRYERKIKEEKEREDEFEKRVSETDVELTLDWLRTHKSDVCVVAFMKAFEKEYGEENTSYSIIRSFMFEKEIPKIEVPFSYECEKIVKTCKILGVKKFAVTGSASGLMEDLFIFSNLGCTFRMDKYIPHYEWEGKEHPMCVIEC